MSMKRVVSECHLVTKLFRNPLLYPGRAGFKLVPKRYFNVTMDTMQEKRHSDHRQRRMNRLKLMNFSMEVDEDKQEVLVHTDGLIESDFDLKNAFPKPWKLMKLLESAWFVSHHRPLDESGRTFRDYVELTADRSAFLVATEMTINENIYNTKISKSPLDVKVQGGHFGNTSWNTCTAVFTLNGDELLSNTNQFVSVSKTTHQPLPLPDWWKNKYATAAEKFCELKVHKYEKPDSVNPFKIVVVPGDLDENNHVSWTVYVRYSLSSFYHFSKIGSLSHVVNAVKSGLKHMEVIYCRESTDGDVLDVYVWEHADRADTLCVHICKQESLIFQGTFEYFN